MMQTAQFWHRDDVGSRVGSACLSAAGRSLLVQPQVGPVVVVIADIVIHQSLQMSLVEHEHMIEQIAATVANKSLSDSVLPRAFERRADWLCAQNSGGLHDLCIENRVTVVTRARTALNKR